MKNNNLSSGTGLHPINKRFQDRVKNFNSLRHNTIGLKDLANKTIMTKSVDFGERFFIKRVASHAPGSEAEVEYVRPKTPGQVDIWQLVDPTLYA